MQIAFVVVVVVVVVLVAVVAAAVQVATSAAENRSIVLPAAFDSCGFYFLPFISFKVNAIFSILNVQEEFWLALKLLLNIGIKCYFLGI